jgi:uncharacterized protein YjbI with pentapeptide repeats
MIQNRERQPPKNWADFHRSVRFKWLLPFLFADWLIDWAAYGLSRSSLLEFLEYCSTFSILIAVIFYFRDAPERRKVSHYQAWQVINIAQGKGGSGGRGDALHELNEDHVPLVGVDLSEAFLQNLDLQHADLRRSKFHNTDLKGANLSQSNLEQSALVSANLRNSQLVGVNFSEATLFDSDLSGAVLTGCDLSQADLRTADLAGVMDWNSITNVKLADIHGIQNAPEGFIAWAKSKGAVDLESDKDWEAAIQKDEAAK